MNIRRRWVFTGRVQGVGFRFFCQSSASARRARGWVRNLPDGSVEMEAEAAPEVLDELERHLSSAHPWARVERCSAESRTPLNNNNEGFDIRQ